MIPLGPAPVIVPEIVDLFKTLTQPHDEWHVDHQQDRSVFQCDVPGCKEADVKVEISDRELTVTAVRAGRGPTTKTTAIDAKLYDINRARAYVEDGVCTIEVPYESRKPETKIQVPITKK